MSGDSGSAKERPCWFVGASFGGNNDQTQRFLDEGIWENGYSDKYLDKVRAIEVGDRIAIKSSYTRKHGLPFDNRDQTVSVMSIKAIGTVTGNPGDGRVVEVDWTPVEPSREWLFYTNRSTIWRVPPDDWKREGLIAFAFDNVDQDVDRFRNAPFWRERFGDTPGEERLQWMGFYEALADGILRFRDRRDELVAGIHEIAGQMPGLSSLQDQFSDGTRGPLRDICPFTVMALFNRGTTESKRKAIAGKLANLLSVTVAVPPAFEGIPLVNNQKSWFFSFENARKPDDIERLWELFAQAIRYADDEEEEEASREAFSLAYDGAGSVRGVGWNATMGLFWIRPHAYPTLDGPSRDYLRNRLGIDFACNGPVKRCSAADYLDLVDTLTERFQDDAFPVRSFPELSLVAWEGGEGDPPPLEPFPLNQILYGPPGTGKTYSVPQEAVDIIEGKAERSKEKYRERFQDLVDAERVCFVTFHQSYAYEDFVEGIRPVLDDERENGMPRYECRDGLFKRIAVDALYASLEKTEGDAPSFEGRWEALLETIEQSPDEEHEGLTDKTSYTFEVSSQGSVIGHNVKNPNAGHYTCSRKLMRQVFSTFPTRQEVTNREVNNAVGAGNHSHFACIVFRVLMAQTVGSASAMAPEATSYEARKDVVQAYLDRPSRSGYALRATEQCPRYVLIIDEINRGNISKILGELVTLLEKDKRIGEEQELRLSLPYSGERFGVPSNLYVLGTMNTADKSIALVDIALRRRFKFRELMPDMSVCEGLSAEMRQVLGELNKRITLYRDRDHQIGHSYFMTVNDAETFNREFRDSVIPLLQEYFYNAWDGLRHVLGEGNGGGFIRELKGSNVKGARNKWQWFTDAGETSLDCLEQLLKNYGIAAQVAAE